MTTALYRRYRPDTFQDVIGQEHVTDALQNALSTSRIAHAFLFSGPRGCGKTSSARILARSLNCAEGPTPTPCGKCESCVELAVGGPGSLDVIEIDAASNAGVEDARSLRERAEFAPSRDRYRIFILDEAHMVTRQGFNALLKIVEEPPEHVKFIFATTDPDQVISTIRSRTHHYPFRLVPPNTMLPFLRKICAKENVTIDESALPLVVRAGGGSVRDSLSVLDQLIAGSDGNVTLPQASHLLGFTDTALLDRMVDALGINDGAAAFGVVEEVVEAGHEPRRFVEDLLQRLRDMVVATLAGPERSADILVGVPADQLGTMLQQGQAWGTKLLSRRADMVEEALREMTGATAPRLQLELLLARLLVEQPAGATVPSPNSEAVSPSRMAPRVATKTEVRPEAVVVEPTVVGPAATPEPVESLPVQEPSAAASEVEQVVEEDRSYKPEVDVTVAAPTKDEVRSKWRPLLASLSSRSALYGSLMGATRGVSSQGHTVRFVFAEEGYVKRFKNLGGEKDLGEVLSELFEMTLLAEVGTESQFANPTSAADKLPTKSEAEESALRPAVDRAVGSEEHSGTVDVSALEEPPVPEDMENEPELDVPSDFEPAPDPGPRQSPEPAQVLDPASAAPVEPSEDVDARYRGMPATDRVLDILGGQVVDEVFEQPEGE